MFINGRRKLEAICPNCNCNLANKMGVSESSLVCIPVIGKKSAGKTCYITSVMKDITSKVMKNQMVASKYKLEFAFYQYILPGHINEIPKKIYTDMPEGMYYHAIYHQ